MRILYLHQYFKTPAEGGAIRSYYLGKALADKGHEVVMLTSWKGNKLKQERIAGMEVIYLPVSYSNHMGFWGRSRAFIEYLRLAEQQLDKLVPADLVYATSTPLTIGLLALYVRWRYKIPFIFEVRDLWPDAPIELGFIRNKQLIMGLRKLEKTLYQKAEVVVALSPGIAEGIKKVQPEAKLHMAPNMADCSFFKPTSKPEELVERWGLAKKFVISYTGAAGVANQLEYLLDAAKACLEAKLPVQVLIAAEGSQLEALKLQAKELDNVMFLPYGSKEEVREYLAVSDAAYTSFAPKAVLQACSPNKFFDGLAAGKLCIVNTPGWLKDLVEQQGCGFYAPPESPQKFVELLLPYLQDKDLLRQAQQRARHTAEMLFSRRGTASGIVALVEEVAAAQRSSLG